MIFFSALWGIRNVSRCQCRLLDIPIEVITSRERASASGHLGLFRMALYEQTGKRVYGHIAAFRTREPASLDLGGFTFHAVDCSGEI